MQAIRFRIRPGPSRIVPIRVGPGALDLLLEDVAAHPPGRLLVVVSDSNVGPLHGDPLCRRLGARGLAARLLTFPAGERSKTRETKAALEDRLLEIGAGRDTALVALGGGVTGDIAGFVAATWQRGIPVVQAPTSLLAMADAALGGKTAVDLPSGKNLVGAFHHPSAIYADIALLSTLPEADYVAGFAEVIKSAAIGDAKLFRWLEGSVGVLRARDPEALEHAVAQCLRLKARVVSRDEREIGRRAILNFGHTVAHAIEAASGYRLAHGPAVAVGMVVEGRVAVGLSGFPPEHLSRLERLLEAFGLETKWPAELHADAVIAATTKDKKTRAGQVRCALPRRLGQMLPGDDVTLPVGEAVLREAISRTR